MSVGTTQDQAISLDNLPSAKSSVLIDFERARVVFRHDPTRYILVVEGLKPYANMEVRLVPLIYIRQPEYWGIEVVGSLPDIGLPVMTPYSVHLDITGILGTKGIVVIGATKVEQIDLHAFEEVAAR